LGIAYILTGAQSLQYIERLATGGSALPLSGWIFLFAASQVRRHCSIQSSSLDRPSQPLDSQVVLAQVPNFHQLWYVSVVGALMSAGYCLIASVAASMRAGDEAPSFARRADHSSADAAFGVLASIGTVMFSFGGHSVLLEIQATLKAPPDPAVSMMQGARSPPAFLAAEQCRACTLAHPNLHPRAGVYAAYAVAAVAYLGVAVGGYMAFGNAVEPDVLLSLEHPHWLIGVANAMVVLHVAASYQARTTSRIRSASAQAALMAATQPDPASHRPSHHPLRRRCSRCQCLRPSRPR